MEKYIWNQEEQTKQKCWRRPIFPGRFQPSIFGAGELNFCVRNGNRWTLTVKITTYSAYACQRTICSFGVGIDLFSRAASSQVSSAQMSLTSVFGMGTGGPSSLKIPTMVHLQGFEPGTHWLRVSCSTNWAKGACSTSAQLAVPTWAKGAKFFFNEHSNVHWKPNKGK